MQHGDAVLLCTTDESLENERRHLNLMMGESVEGVIAVPTLEDPGPLLELRRSGIPIVLIDRTVAGHQFDAVMADHAAGARALVEHLIGHGHRHIGLLTVRAVATASSERLRGAREAVAAHPGTRLTVLDSSMLDGQVGTRDWGIGEGLVRRMLELPDVPTAVFCTNNLLSVGALRGARRAGVRVPDDLALVGFDDEVSFDLLDPPLTVAAQPIEEIGRTATELLYRRIAAPSRRPRAVVLPVELRIRASCGCVDRSLSPVH
jgi:LacI family transcriptional regulator